MDIAGISNGTQFWAGSSSLGSTTIRTGDGDDEINISMAFIVGTTEVDAGAGNDAVHLDLSAISGNTSILGGDGHDKLTVETTYLVAAIVLNGGLGADSVHLTSSIAMGSASIAGGDGHDVSEIANLSSPALERESRGRPGRRDDARVSLGELLRGPRRRKRLAFHRIELVFAATQR